MRRGAVQWRLNMAPQSERWTLEEISWWAGWSQNTNVDLVSHDKADDLLILYYLEKCINALCHQRALIVDFPSLPLLRNSVEELSDAAC